MKYTEQLKMLNVDMKKLTICFTFCDKDQHLVERLLNQIKSRVKVSYDLIINDNRKDKSISLPFDDLISFKFNNEGCFIPRKNAVQHLNSEYLWYIDADDEIVGDITEDTFKSNADIIAFKVYDSSGNYTGVWPSVPDEEYGKENIQAKSLDYIYHKVGPCWWNKFIKSDIAKRITDIPDFNCVCYEDNFTNTYLMKFVKDFTLLDQQLYQYDIENSDLRSNNVTIEQFERLCIGSSTIYQYKPLLFTKEELETIEEWLVPCHSCRALLHLIARSPIENVEYEFSLLRKEFSIEVLQEAIKRFLQY